MRLAVFTSGRQDWGILLPVVRALQASSSLQLLIIAGGMHGRDGQRPTTLDGCLIAEFVNTLPMGDDPLSVAHAAAATTSALTDTLIKLHADALLLLGDRTETLAAALAATCLHLPIFHLHGGEETTGAIDNACRHALTQLAHLHFVAHPAFAERVKNMGAPANRVVVCGAPAIDLLLATELFTADKLAKELGLTSFGTELIVCTYHPTTIAAQSPAQEITTVILGITDFLSHQPSAHIIVTRANCDAGGAAINTAMENLAARHAQVHLVKDLGVQRYWSLLAHAQVMLGNSSSGILEAPCFDLPVINIGDRQAGRLRVHPVHDVPVDPQAISAALRDALRTPKLPVQPHASAYGDGHAAKRICVAIEHFSHSVKNNKQLQQVTP